MDESYWTYRAATPTPRFDELPEGAFRGSEASWRSLTPGMRREIARQFQRSEDERRRLRRIDERVARSRGDTWVRNL